VSPNYPTIQTAKSAGVLHQMLKTNSGSM